MTESAATPILEMGSFRLDLGRVPSFSVNLAAYPGVTPGANIDDALAHAMADLSTQGGGELLLPPFTMYFSGITLPAVSGIRIRGTGADTGDEQKGTILVKTDGTKHGITVPEGIVYVELADMIIDGADLAGGGHGVYLAYSAAYSAGYVYLNHVTARHNSGVGIHMGKAWIVRAERLIAYKNTVAGIQQDGGTVTQYESCVSYSNTGKGWVLNYVTGLTLLDCVSESNGGNGIEIASSTTGAPQLINCHWENEVHGDGLHVWGDVAIHGGRIYGCGKADNSIYPINVDGGSAYIQGIGSQNTLSTYVGKLGANGAAAHVLLPGNLDKPFTRVNAGLDKALMLIDGDVDAKGGYKQTFLFAINAVPQGVNNQYLAVSGASGIGITMPFPGSMRAVSVRLGSVVTGGTLTVRPAINGNQPGALQTAAGVGDQMKYATIAKDYQAATQFAAGDVIECAIYTTADFNPGTNLVVAVTVEF